MDFSRERFNATAGAEWLIKLLDGLLADDLSDEMNAQLISP